MDENFIFRNREKSLKLICKEKGIPLLNFYGEAGIGKSRLLKEAQDKIKKDYKTLILICIDLEDIAKIDSLDLKKEKLLELLVNQLGGLIRQLWVKKSDQAVGQIVAELLGKSKPGYLFFDTTEAIQDDTLFWAWLEEFLIGPLIVRGEENIKMVFAGRMPVPFQRHEVRRSLKLTRLDPLDKDKEGKELILEVLKKKNDQLTSEDLEAATQFVLDFSFGHPGLSELISIYLAPLMPLTFSKEIEQSVCEDVIEPYIKETLLGGIDDEWSKILRLASVLDWFDPYILRKFVDNLLPDVAQGKTEAFYIQGIAQMRRKKSVVWSEQQGDRLHGVLREIIRRQFQVKGERQVESERQPEVKNQYQEANRVAANIIRELKDQAQEAGETDLNLYDQQIRKYQKRVEG